MPCPFAGGDVVLLKDAMGVNKRRRQCGTMLDHGGMYAECVGEAVFVGDVGDDGWMMSMSELGPSPGVDGGGWPRWRGHENGVVCAHRERGRCMPTKEEKQNKLGHPKKERGGAI